VPPESAINARYRVEVPGVDPMLLAAVQMVEPQAFIRTQAQSIQVGSFATEGNARQRVQDLAQRGVLARVVPVGTMPQVTTWGASDNQLRANNTDLMLPPSSPKTVDFSAPSAAPLPDTLIWPAPSPAAPALKDYVVVIPATKDALSTTVQKIQQTGYTGAIQMQPSGRLGSFVAAGGFAQRSDAEYWNKQFRSMGFDARVVFFH
jgi:cell division septation protein DedD